VRAHVRCVVAEPVNGTGVGALSNMDKQFSGSTYGWQPYSCRNGLLPTMQGHNLQI
jgi:hypothetical protein